MISRSAIASEFSPHFFDWLLHHDMPLHVGTVLVHAPSKATQKLIPNPKHKLIFTIVHLFSCLASALSVNFIPHAHLTILVSVNTESYYSLLYFTLHFNDHFFPHGPGLTGIRMSPSWILLELRVMEAVVTAPSLFYRPDALPVAQPIWCVYIYNTRWQWDKARFHRPHTGIEWKRQTDRKTGTVDNRRGR